MAGVFWNESGREQKLASGCSCACMLVGLTDLFTARIISSKQKERKDKNGIHTHYTRAEVAEAKEKGLYLPTGRMHNARSQS